uniref:Uncharacterized protein n=1 Tax=Amphimedon queenslandica TaxID=400682 RepID=A0A1X7SJP9_AMPQE
MIKSVLFSPSSQLSSCLLLLSKTPPLTTTNCRLRPLFRRLISFVRIQLISLGLFPWIQCLLLVLMMKMTHPLLLLIVVLVVQRIIRIVLPRLCL